MKFSFKNKLYRALIVAVAALGILCVLGGSAFASAIPAQGAVRPDGTRIYVGDITNNRLIIVDSNNTTQRIITNLGGDPLGMAVTPDCTKLYVAVDKGFNSNVLVFNIGSYGSPSDPTSAAEAETITLSGTTAPKHVAVSPSGDKVYVADSTANKVHVIDTSTDTLDPAIDVGYSSLYGIAVKPDGSRLYVSQRTSSGKVFVYDISGSPSSVTTISGLVNPTYLAFSDDGASLYVKVYETSGNYYDVSRFTTANDSYTNDGNIQVIAANESDIANPYEGMALSSNSDYIYVSHWRDLATDGVRVYKYPKADLSSRSLVAIPYAPKDWVGAAPDGLSVWINHSGAIDQDHQQITSNTGYSGSGIPYPPRFTSPLKGETITGGNATWDPSTGGSGSYTYYVQYVVASNIASNNWSDLGNTTGTSYSLSALSDEIYYLRARADDGAYYSKWAYTGPFTLDRGAPGAPQSLSATPSGWTNINSFSVSWTNPIDPSGIVAAWYKLDSAPIANDDGTRVAGVDITSISNITVSGEGAHAIYVWLEDGIGNIDYNNNSNTTLYYDSTSPTADITSPTAGESVGGVVDIIGTADDNLSFTQYVLDYEDVSNPGTWIEITTSTSAVTGTTLGNWDVTGLNNGQYTIRLTVSDEAGNPDAVDTVTVTVDNPIISNVDPSESNRFGNIRLLVTITCENTNFVDGVSVADFGSGITVNSTTVNSPTEAVADITVSSSATTGSRDVTVTTGAEVAVMPGGFTVTDTMISVSPNSDTFGNTIDITIAWQSGDATDFDQIGETPEVHFFYPNGEVTDDPYFHVNSVNVVDDNSIEVNVTIDPTTEASYQGFRDVQVKTGYESVTRRLGFSAYTASVSLDPFSWSRGNTIIGVAVTGNNTHFTRAVPTIIFYMDGTLTEDTEITVSNIIVIGDENLTFDMTITSAADQGLRDVEVKTGEELTMGTFNVLIPQLTVINPTFHSQGNTIDVVINGTNTHFTQATPVVTFSKTGGTGITVNGDPIVTDDTELTVNITIDPDATTGLWDITVQTDMEIASRTDAFTVYDPQLIIVDPNSGSQGDTGLSIDITGQYTHFSTVPGETTVVFSGTGITVNSVTVTDDTHLNASIDIDPGAPQGPRDVTVTTTNASQNESATLVDGFTVGRIGTGIDRYEGAEVDPPTGAILRGGGGTSGGYYLFAGSTGISTIGITSPSYDGTQMMEVLYSYSSGWGDGWGGTLITPIDINTSGLNAVSFHVRGDNSNNTYHIEIVANDDTLYESPDYQLGPSSVWETVAVSYTDLTKVSGVGDNIFADRVDKTIKGYQFVYNGTNTSSTSHYIENVEAIVYDSLAPDAITDLRARKSGSDIVLDWSAVLDNPIPGGSGVAMYKIYRGTTPDFTPGPSNLIGTVPSAMLTYTDTGAADPSDTNDYYYIVRAIDNQGNEAANSNMAYKMISAYNLSGANTFWISIPYFNDFTDAQSVADYLNNGLNPNTGGTVTGVSRFNPTTQLWESLVWSDVLGIWQGNFTVVQGEGLKISTTATTSVPIVGAFDPSYIFNWSAGDQFISIPYSATYADAQAIADGINSGGDPMSGCSMITRWNSSSGVYETFTWSPFLGEWTGTNFSFIPGEAYMIKINAPISWSPSAY